MGERINPPIAPKIPHDVGVHGDPRVDDYYWLRERERHEVVAYLEAENAYTNAMMAHTEKLKNRLFKEIVGRIKETDESVPDKIDDYYYYTRTIEGCQYSIHCRKRGSLDAAEQVILDENQLAEGRAYFSVGALKVSPNHKLLAYSVDIDGSESHTLYVKNLDTGELLDEAIPNTYYGVEWANDNETIFYNTLDDAMRPHMLFRHQLGTPHQKDTILFHETDGAYFLGLRKTKSRRFIFVSLASNTTSEVHYLEADDSAGTLRIIQPRIHELEYRVVHHDKSFYILTNDGAKNFKLVEAPIDNPGRANWKDVIPHRKDVKVDDIEAFRNHLVLYERKNGLRKIRVIDLASGDFHYVEFPESVYTFWEADNPEYESDVLRFNYTSLVTPRTVFDYHMGKKQTELKKRYEILGGFDSSQYESTRVSATGRDGTKIPISLVYRKELTRNGRNPLFLYGYGAYGSSVEPMFLSSRLSLLERGFVFAIAHVRGGGEMGRDWYEQGKQLHKKNTFSDFIACAESLVQLKYTSPGRMAIYGGSAGGLLMGVAANTRPEFFRCVIAHVPFVDVLTTMLDESIPLTVTEFEEWGNPKDERHYHYILSYSPYDNVKRQHYPHMLVTAGLNDPRVQYWEPAKWVAKLRTLKTDDNLLLLRTKTGEGHSGASGRYDYIRDVAFEYAFLFHCFDITE